MRGMRQKITLILAVNGVLFAYEAAARTIEPMPDLDTWVAETVKKPWAEDVVPVRIQLLGGGIGTASSDAFVENALDYRPLSPFSFVDKSSAFFSTRLNPGDGTKPNPAGSPANLIFSDIKGKSAAVYINDGRKVRKLGNVAPYRGDAAPASVLQWTFQSLGYDGVILAVKDIYALVAGSAQVMQGEKIQALAIRSSEKSIALLTKKRSGSGLLQLEKSKGGFAIFRILAKAKDTSELVQGTKLTIQKQTTATK